MSCCSSSKAAPPRVPSRIRDMTCQEKDFWDPQIQYTTTMEPTTDCKNFSWGTVDCENTVRPVNFDKYLHRRLCKKCRKQ